MKKISILLSIIVLCACEKELPDFEIPREEDKLTMQTVLSTNDSISALVGESVYSLSPNTPQARDSYTVVLFENNVAVDTLEPRLFTQYRDWWVWQSTSQDVYKYYSNVLAQPGKTYRLEASSSGFKQIDGTTTVLQPTTVSYGGYDQSTLKYRIQFDDVPSSTDYYRIRVLVDYQNDGNLQPTQFYFTDPTVESFGYSDPIEPDEETYADEVFVRDEFFKNGSKVFDFAFYLEPGSSVKVYAEVSRISEALYKFSRSYALYYFGDEIFGEPVQIFSNINNGYGIVGSAANTRVELTR